MHINRQTYEEFFLLYTDGELNLEERKAVEDFVNENPDLKQELLLLQDSVFAPDESIVFENKETLFRHEHKVVAFPWFRVAAAAIVVLSLGTAGWMLLRNSSDVPPQVVASKELVRDEDAGNNFSTPIHKEEPSVSTVSETPGSPAEKLGIDPRDRSASVRITLYEKPDRPAASINKALKTENERADAVPADERKPELVTPEHEVVEMTNQESSEILDVAVAPRSIDEVTDEPYVKEVSTIHYVEENDNNTIYFANTSLPKKSKLRGVFRKATRFLDKVTSLQ
jgi:hypothetical protein